MLAKRKEISGKLLICKAVIKPVWIYEIQLWGTASNSNIDHKGCVVLIAIVNATCNVPNSVISE